MISTKYLVPSTWYQGPRTKNPPIPPPHLTHPTQHKLLPSQWGGLSVLQMSPGRPSPCPMFTQTLWRAFFKGPTKGPILPLVLFQLSSTPRGGGWVGWYLVLGSKDLVPSEYKVLGVCYQVLGTKCLVLGTKYLVPGTWCRVLGTKCLVFGTDYLVPSAWY